MTLTDSEAALAEAVLLHGPVSRRALTKRLGMSAASLTRLAKPFLERGLFVEIDEDLDGTVGRPARPLDIAKGLPAFAGVKLTGENVHVVATDVRTNELASCELPLSGRSPREVVSVIAEGVDRLGVPGIAGLGVSVGGSVADGVIRRAPFLEWTNIPFAQLLRDSLGIPVSLENDLVALAEAERWFGLGKDLPGYAIITIGAGIGYALVMHGKVVRSPDSGEGVAAHVSLSAEERSCHEGHTGCAQAMLTDEHIAAAVSEVLGRSVDWTQALELAEHDSRVLRVLEGSGEALGRFIALAANMTLQSDVILAGEGIALLSLTEATVRRTVSANRDPMAVPVTLHVDNTGFRAWARGAASVAIQASVNSLNLR